ncbi:DoxX family membrane protein, partial [bacterium CPR1]|nr:DoxX family membrane protein [bacterium CPR1]
MDFCLFTIRLALTVTLLTAGVAKLWDPPGTRATLTSFGVPSAWARLATVGLPILEVALAVGFMPVSTAALAAWGTMGLFIAFELAIAANLLQGRRPGCNCFGQLASAPLSWWHFFRNLGFLRLAAVLAAFGGQDPGLSWLTVLG